VPRRSTNRDLVEVTVLALLLQQPRHPYELHRFILDTHKDYVSGLPRSLYHAVDRLAGEGLIEPVDTAREGRRPERTVYRITEEGRAELTTRLRRMLERPDPDTTVLTAAVSLMACLPLDVAESSLRTRVAALEGAVAGADATLTGLQESGLPRMLLLEVEYERAVRAAELAWLRGLLDDLRTGALAWPALPQEAGRRAAGDERQVSPPEDS